jgi:hypothetical protein
VLSLTRVEVDRFLGLQYVELHFSFSYFAALLTLYLISSTHPYTSLFDLAWLPTSLLFDPV